MRKENQRIPFCEHHELGQPERFFEIKYVEACGYHPHLHCPACNVTARVALRKKVAQRFRGYGVRPADLAKCEWCNEWYHPDTSESDRVCYNCDTLVFVCESCESLLPIEYLNDEGFCRNCGGKA